METRGVRIENEKKFIPFLWGGWCVRWL